jgi:hypothetical protein
MNAKSTLTLNGDAVAVAVAVAVAGGGPMQYLLSRDSLDVMVRSTELVRSTEYWVMSNNLAGGRSRTVVVTERRNQY